MSDALVQRINQKLEAINTRAGEISTIGSDNQNAVAQLAPRIQDVRTRIGRLRQSLMGIIEAKRQLEETLNTLDPRLEEIQRQLQQGVDRINLDGIEAELRSLDDELNQLEAAMTGAGLPRPPNAPPGGQGDDNDDPRTPPPDTGDAPLPGDQGRFLQGGYVIPKHKKRTPSHHSTGRRSTGRKTARKSARKSSGRRSTGGKKTKKVKKH
jgi:ABC-type transporter Mla subunit MlaD